MGLVGVSGVRTAGSKDRKETINETDASVQRRQKPAVERIVWQQEQRAGAETDLTSGLDCRCSQLLEHLPGVHKGLCSCPVP